MNINIICIGKIKDKYINEGIAEFSKRMTSFASLNIIELKEYNKEDSINISIEKESSEILKEISKSNSYNILLDLDGKEITSENMSKYIDDLKNKGISSINFIIGGSNGVSKEVKNSVDMKLKFSHFTFPHQLMRLILLEQVYRWFAISNNIKYHK
ncbi:23S rRNA (pseudouridine(1915)-N(3))-methyltransferase RlmH [Fusobacterium polymorphum]|uniref:Ribosomal RNA large subunit methyltransferase H n=1 Tax=Fusobacterium nucleatum subsp. polymorphum TaxID=76857 RepID=A0A2B7YKX4_FUSNP|nr:23S rRNA (pseudouridine(1915)-N(3))-methyltransferase RlmH [Fusobacterium polymorphum]PGH21711.1 23S rRNA (pseudouridine(1915)-N(3))-methyltransferase RlmH [Fusobacterium polymorphum]